MPHSKGQQVRILILAFVAIALPFYVSEFMGESPIHSSDAWYLRILNRDYWYRRFAPGGPRQTRIDEIKIVSIARNVEPGSALGENRCTHRAFMAKLLTKVAEADPRLIVIDKWYGHIPAGVCTATNDRTPGTNDRTPRTNDGTPALRNAIQTIAAKVPIVIAVGSYNRDDVQQFCPSLRPEDLQPEEHVLGDYEPLNAGAPDGRVELGLARLNADARKIPLGWMIFRGCAQVGHQAAEMFPTIAIAAATLLDPNIMMGNDLNELKYKITHPYTKLVPEGSFKSVSAISLLCNQADPNVDWNQCSLSEGDAKGLASLGHKVVIVGETWSDLHKTDVGVMTGPALQANYIASLLDESILKPAPQWVNYAVSAGWLVVMFWIFYGWKPELPELAVIVSAVMTFGLGVLFNAVITRQWGIFADVVPPTILEIIGLYLARRIELSVQPKKQ